MVINEHAFVISYIYIEIGHWINQSSNLKQKMAKHNSHVIALLFMVAMSSIVVGGYTILLGAYYGSEANNLPPPWKVVQLCQEYNIRRIRFNEPNLNIIEEFRGTDIEVSFSVPGELITNMATNHTAVEEWFVNYITIHQRFNHQLHRCWWQCHTRTGGLYIARHEIPSRSPQSSLPRTSENHHDGWLNRFGGPNPSIYWRFWPKHFWEHERNPSLLTGTRLASDA